MQTRRSLLLTCLVIALLAAALIGRGQVRSQPAQTAAGAASRQAPAAQLSPGPRPSADPALPFYGTQYVLIEELPQIRDLGFNLVLTDFSYAQGPADWLDYLDAAQAQEIKVIPWLWPEGWRLNRSTGEWKIDNQAKLFLRTVASHPALLAVYGLHEPYWNECDNCGYSTAHQQALYREIKAIVPVPIYSEINGFDFWAERGSATTIAPGVCDYCQTAYYPFRTNGDYERDELIAHVDREIAALQRHAPEAQLIWTMQSMSHRGDRLRMPTSAEMIDYAQIVYARPEISGGWWYMWRWEDDLYPDTLADTPGLHATVREIADTIVAPLRPPPLPPPPQPPTPTQAPETSQARLVYFPKVSRPAIETGASR